MNRHRNGIALFLTTLLALTMFCAKDINSPLNALLPFGTISGTVVDRGNAPLAGVNVTIGARGPSAVTDEHGDFKVVSVPSSANGYTVRFFRSGYLDTSAASGPVYNGQEKPLTHDVVMTVATAVIRGTVTANGSTKAGIGVAVVNQSVSTITSSGGAFLLPGVQPDGKLIIAADGESGYEEKPVTLSPGETLSVAITISTDNNGGIITGIVVDSSGKPKPGVVVSTVGGGIRDTTSADGFYRLDNVPTSVPVDVATSSGSGVKGLRVDNGGLLTNIDIQPVAVITGGDISITDSRYIVPEDSAVTISVSIKNGAEKAGFYLWDIDNDGSWDTTTSAPNFTPSGTSIERIRCGIVSTGGDTVGGSTIEIVRVSTSPVASATPADTTILRRSNAHLRGSAHCQAGGISGFNWDFDGNGTIDWTRRDAGIVAHRYNSTGINTARFIITGTNGTSDTAIAMVRVSSDSIVPSDTELIPPFIVSPVNGDSIEPFMHMTLSDSPAAGVYWIICGGRRSPTDTVLIDSLRTVMAFTEGLHAGVWFIQTAAVRGPDTAWGDVVSFIVRDMPPSISLLGPLGDTVGGDSIKLSWYGNSFKNTMLTYDIMFGADYPPGEYRRGLVDSAGTTCSLFVAPATGWSDSTLYYWEIAGFDAGGDTTRAIDSFFYAGASAPVDTGTDTSTASADTSAGATFAAGPALKQGRAGQVVSRGLDNSIILFGGHGSGYTSMASAEYWTPAADSFELITTGFAHDFPAVARLADGRFLVAGGATDLGGAPGYATAELFDPATRQFTALTATLQYARCTPGACVLTNGNVLIAGGWYADNPATYPEIYDTAARTFTVTGPLVNPRSRPIVLAVANANALVLGGMPTYGGAVMKAVELYSSATGTFSQVSPELIGSDTGWLPNILDNYLRETALQKTAGGSYILSASRDKRQALVSVDPSTNNRSLITISPPLPSADSAGCWWGPIVDAVNNRAYVLAQDPLSTTTRLRVYTVNLTTGTRSRPTGWVTLTPSFAPSGIGMILLADGRIMLSGGSADGSGYNPVTYTWFVTPN